MKTICLESPLAASGSITMEEHQQYAAVCMYILLDQGYAPYVSHLLYTHVLDDTKPAEREIGLQAGLAFGDQCEERWFFTDYGFSPGMRLAYDRAQAAGQPVRIVSVSQFGKPPAQLSEL